MQFMPTIRRIGAAVLIAALSNIAVATAQDNVDATLVSADAAGGIDALIAKAKAEGALLVYGAPSADKMTAWFAGFEARYGIPVQYYRAPTNPLYQRFSQEQTAGRKIADAFMVSDLNVINDAISKHWLTQYTPQTADQFPEATTIPGFAYPTYLSLQAIAWNTRVVPEDLQKALMADPLDALLDARLKDKIAVVKVTAGGPQIAANANIVLNQSEQYGWEYLEKLAGQNPAVVATSPAALDSVIAGDYWATLDGYDSIFSAPALDGAPVAFAFPKVAAATEFYLSVAANAAHPNAARLFSEWSMSAEAQNELANISQAAVTMEGWQDQRKIAQQPWFKAPQELWFGAATDPRLAGDKLNAFYARWQDIFGE